jgi:hypothetical protein
VRRWGAILLAGFILGGCGGAPRNAASLSPVPQEIAPAPPPVAVQTNPVLVQIPGTEVYYVPQLGARLYFFDGRWFYHHNGFWYSSQDYAGPWVHLPKAKLPPALAEIPVHR